MTTFLLGSCPYDSSTKYGYIYIRRLAEKIVELNHRVILLRHANLQEFKYVLETFNPFIVVLNGHGGSKGISGCNGNIILGVKGYDPDLEITIYGDNTSWLKEKIVYLFSCNCGKELALALINAGALAVAAYRDEFLFITDDEKPPLKDKYAKAFFTSALQLPLHLAYGATFGEACEATRNAFLYYIEHFEKLGDEETAKLLWHNYLNFVCYGNMSVKIT